METLASYTVASLHLDTAERTPVEYKEAAFS
jgi:hypothetical protein